MSKSGRFHSILFALCILVAGSPVFAQSWLNGYVQTVPVVSGSSPFTLGELSNFNRFRLEIQPTFENLTFHAAYEQTAVFRRRSIPAGFDIGAVPGGGEWLDLQWAIREEEHGTWGHRFDRLSVAWNPSRLVGVSVGRQAVSWGTTMFLTPADPFSPFSPADPFRQYRPGVDVARVRINPTPLSEVDVVVRATKTPIGEEVTALGRGLITVQNWELSGWGGTLYDDLAGAFAAAGGIGAFAVRAEVVLRDVAGRGAEIRGTVGVDRMFQVAGRDLYMLAEYQHDGLASGSVDEYVGVLLSEPFARGELQVLGRDETVFQATYQLHPLLGVGGLWLWNLNDRSALLAPSIMYSASDNATVTAGIQIGLGNDQVTEERPLPSEYGLAGSTAFASLSWFF